MPIYEYTCQNCGRDFETLVRAGEKPECPECGPTTLTKRFSVPAAHSAQAKGGACPAGGPSCGMPSCCGGQCDLS